MSQNLLYLFPPFLDAGSSGTPVDILHSILCSLGFGEGIIRDGEYGPATVSAVQKMQEWLDFKGSEVDGNFGPNTRAALYENTEINVDTIPFSSHYDTDILWYGPEHDGPKKWDGVREDLAA